MSPAPKGAGGDALLADLNEAQAEAVTTTEGPLLVVAGAGTGKTKTLVHRAARLVEMGVAPEQVLLLTFTRRAAEEMRQRAGHLLDARCDRISGGTFHASCCILLRRFGLGIGLDPGFSILDRPDAEDVVGLVRAEMGLGSRSRMFPKKKALLDIISRSVNRDVTIEETVARDYAHFMEHTGDIMALARGYRELKWQRQMLDYDDLLTHTVTLLESGPERQAEVGALFRYIMVDEYQDTNRLQSRLVRLLACDHDNVMAVGDDAQSIYAFRGACFRNIMDFARDFPGARTVALTENYRSTPQVLAVANRIIEGASERYDKELVATREDGDRPTLICAPTENMQSRFLCQQILDLHEEGIPLHEIAVLFRSAFHTFDLEVELARHGLPFVKRGGLKFMETAHVKDALAFMRVLGNPGDTVSWMRLLKLHEGIGDVTARKTFEHLAAEGDPWSAFDSLPLALRGRLAPLAELLRPLTGDALPPADTLERVIAYYTPQLERRYDDHPKRTRDLDQLVVLAERYEALEPFLTDLALEPPEASVAGMSREEKGDHLTLSTIHSAKGLEWRAVFVIWAVDGRFPSAYAEGSEEEMDEERRLMYVAVTRAREHLAITYPVGVYDRATGMILSRPSRFIDGIPADVLEPWALSDDGGPSEAALGHGTGHGMAYEAGREIGSGAVEDDGGDVDDYFRQDTGW